MRLSRAAIAAALSPAVPIDRISPSSSGVHGGPGAVISRLLARGRALPVTTSRLGLIFRARGDRPRELPPRWQTIPWKTE
jgi:hypothetical protein